MNSENSERSTIKIKYVTKSGAIKTYEYKSKYECKGRGKGINRAIKEKYNDIIFDESIKPVDKAYKIYGLMSADEKKQTDVYKIQALIYREIYKKRA